MLDLSKYKTIIFDFDGTIGKLNVDWNGLKQELHEYFLSMFGKDIDFSSISKGHGYVYDFLGEKGEEEDSKITKKYETANLDGFAPNQKCIDLIKQAKQTKVIWSSNHSPVIKEVLNNLGIIDIFECVVGKEHVHYCKPNIDGFNVLTKTVSINPKETLFIGDSDADSYAAKALGIDYLDVTEL